MLSELLNAVESRDQPAVGTNDIALCALCKIPRGSAACGMCCTQDVKNGVMSG